MAVSEVTFSVAGPYLVWIHWLVGPVQKENSRVWKFLNQLNSRCIQLCALVTRRGCWAIDSGHIRDFSGSGLFV